MIIFKIFHNLSQNLIFFLIEDLLIAYLENAILNLEMLTELHRLRSHLIKANFILYFYFLINFQV